MMNIKRFFLHNIGLKLIALVLAIVSWVYIVGELSKATPEEAAALERLLPYRMSAKYIAIQPNVTGKPREGYEIQIDLISVMPEGIMVVGPRSLLDRVTFAKTEPIDISDHVKTFTKDISIMPLAKGLSVKEKIVTVTVPIEEK